MKIHKFYLNGLYLLLDVNSGAVHVIDKIAFDILDVFDGTNDAEVIAALAADYPTAALEETLAELHELIAVQQLFAPDIDVPLTFSEKPVVKSLCLNVAHDCNLRCGYCFAGTGDFGHDRGLMSKTVAEQAVDFLIAQSGSRKHFEVDFFGGEPLLNMETVAHTVAYIRRREVETGKVFKLTLTTNATLLDKEIMNYLNENNISLVLSLDGRKEVHDRMRQCITGDGSYDDAVDNIKKAVASRNGQNYYVRGTYTAYNLDFSNDVLAMADLGLKELSMEPVVAQDVAYALTEADLPLIFQQYELLAQKYLERKANGNGFEFFHFNVDLNNGPCVAKRLSGCGAGNEYLAVTPGGDLYPCHQFVGREDYKVGTVTTGIERPEICQQFRQTHVLAKEACRSCWARFFCSGGCHANNEMFNGTLREPYQLGCRLQKKRLECALMVKAKLALQAQGLDD